jgi:hypothetical protein
MLRVETPAERARRAWSWAELCWRLGVTGTVAGFDWGGSTKVTVGRGSSGFLGMAGSGFSEDRLETLRVFDMREEARLEL